MSRYSKPKGTLDLTPEKNLLSDFICQNFERLVKLFGFKKIRTPVIEYAELFYHSTGEASDIVTKEMYLFTDRGGRRLALRPEGTPGVIRAVLEMKLNLPIRLYYIGPMYRYEKPQKGRFREHYQLGVEALGEGNPYTDAELVYLANQLFLKLGLEKVITEVNNIGCERCRPDFKKALVSSLAKEKRNLCDDCQIRLVKNPLRVFDCKKIECKKILGKAPRVKEYLCGECRDHFAAFLSCLDEFNINNLRMNEYLVRGLDYYTKTTFEFIVASLGAQNSIGGGGRYDNLIETLGGKPAPASGFALGLERIVLALGDRKIEEVGSVFIVYDCEKSFFEALRLGKDLRKNGLKTLIFKEYEKLKQQFKLANELKARFTLIVGEKESQKGVYGLKDMVSGIQEEIPKEKVLEILSNRLGSI